MSSGERPIGAANGKQPNTEALCQTPPDQSDHSETTDIYNREISGPNPHTDTHKGVSHTRRTPCACRRPARAPENASPRAVPLRGHPLRDPWLRSGQWARVRV